MERDRVLECARGIYDNLTVNTPTRLIGVRKKPARTSVTKLIYALISGGISWYQGLMTGK